MDDSKEFLLETKPINKLVWDYALPAIVGTLVNALYNIVDRIFIGQGVGALAISGLAITLPVMNLTGALGMLVGAGASSRISISLGKRDKESAEKILGTSLLLTILLNVVIMTLFFIYLRPILMMFGATEATYQYAYDYLSITLLGNVFVSMCYSFNSMMRASGYPKKAMYTMLIGAVLNIVLDPIFIYVFDMGIKGVAVATVISMFVGMLFVMNHFVQKTSIIRLRRKYLRLDWKIILAIVSIGVSPFSMQIAASAVSGLMNNSLIRYGGDLAVGAFGIWNSFALVIVMLIIGLNQGVQPIMGFNYGAGNYPRVKESLYYALKVGTIMSCVGFVGGMFFPRQLAAIFSTDSELLAISERGIRLAVIGFPIVGGQIVISNFFQSIGYATKSIILSLSRQFLFLVPGIIFLPRFFGLDGLWLANSVADIIAAILALVLMIIQIRLINRKQNEMIATRP